MLKILIIKLNDSSKFLKDVKVIPPLFVLINYITIITIESFI